MAAPSLSCDEMEDPNMVFYFPALYPSEPSQLICNIFGFLYSKYSLFLKPYIHNPYWHGINQE